VNGSKPIATAWGSCSSAAGCITADATGRARTGSGSTASNGRTPLSAWSSTSICWRSIDHLEARLVELDAQLTDIAQTDPYREFVGWLRCFRGIDTLTAILILAELHDFRRFQSARALMAYPGLVPGEDSTGEKHRRGRITRTGHALVRRLLVETAWHYQHRSGVGVALARRRKEQPGRVIAIARASYAIPVLM
jgi:transposase